MIVTFSVTNNNNPDTIYNKLASRLGRAPTGAEIKAEVSRIKAEALQDLATRGKLKTQK